MMPTALKTSPLYRSARFVYRVARDDLFYGTLHLPIGRARQRALLQRTTRSDSHTYTCFHRSPAQLEALVGPVLSRLEERRAGRLQITVFAGSNGGEAYTIASTLLERRPVLDFSIRASDLHREMVEHATRATYSLREITQDQQVPEGFIARTFDRQGDQYVVKAPIRERVRFEQADLLSPLLPAKFPPAPLVFAQNVFFHLPPELAEKAFWNVLATVAPGGFLFLDGMELDMRVALTEKASLEPLDHRVKEIYDHSRLHTPRNWWDFYWGNEPFSYLAANRTRRYCTIFERPQC
jgi:chemotaxis methyl-accepting protein methylase